MKHKGLIILLLMGIFTAWASTVTNQINNVNLGTDSLFLSSNIKLERDSGYQFLWTIRGNADAMIFYQTFHMGFYGDTVRIDTTSTATFSQKLHGKINGDSLMQAWYPMIDSLVSFTRTYDKTITPSDWAFRLGIKLKRKATSPGAWCGSGVGSVATIKP